jgi:hypothetical protein
MIRCAWGDGFRTWSAPQTSTDSASKFSNEYIRWILTFWLSSEDQNSHQGDPFQIWQMQLPLHEKLKLIRCTWVDSCRMWSGPQTSIEKASTVSDECIRWIMIFWPSSEDLNSPRGDPFQVWQMKLPLPEKWEMIRCAYVIGYRTWYGPQTSNERTSTLATEYIG